MTYVESYCVICGAACTNNLNGTQNDIIYDDKNKYVNKYKDWFKNNKFPNERIEEYDWLENLCLLTDRNEVIKITKEKNTIENGWGEYIIKNKIYPIIPALWHTTPSYYKTEGYEIGGYGLVVHQDCYLLIEKIFDYKLLFGHLARFPYTNYKTSMKPTKFGKDMSLYNGTQNFDAITVHIKHQYLINSPLKNEENARRIIAIWKPYIFRFKKRGLRNSPTERAALLKIGTNAIGNDKKEYIVKIKGGVKKWIIQSKFSQ